MADDFQYVKLPNGEYGKFRSDASDDMIRQAIMKDFPDAFKTSTTGPTIGPTNYFNPKAPATVPGAQFFAAALGKLREAMNMTPAGSSKSPLEGKLGDISNRLQDLMVGNAEHGGMKTGFLNNPVTMAIMPGSPEAFEATGELAENALAKGVDLAKRGGRAVAGGARSASDFLTGTTKAIKEAEEARAAALAEQQEAIRGRGIGRRVNVSRYQQAEKDLMDTNLKKLVEHRAKLAEIQAKIPPPAPGEQQNWIDLNKAIQTSANPSQVRVYLKAGATDFSDVTAMPGRGLAAEGFNAQKLAKMSPLEQRKVLDPIITKAGKAVSDVANAATGRGVKVDLYSLDEAVDSLADSKDREAVHNIVNRIGESLGIKNWGSVTPSQALKLRQELYAAGGDNAEFASRAITKQLREAVPKSQAIDRHFTDLASARTANDKALARFAAGKWRFPELTPKLPDAPTLKEFSHPAYKALPKVPETPPSIDPIAIRSERTKETAKSAAKYVIPAGLLAEITRELMRR